MISLSEGFALNIFLVYMSEINIFFLWLKACALMTYTSRFEHGI